LGESNEGDFAFGEGLVLGVERGAGGGFDVRFGISIE
jgi:hypothetical protein